MSFSLERLRQSLRLLLRHKSFAALAIISLGIGIALNTTMYSALDAMISPRVDMRAPERLFNIGYYGDYKRQIPHSVKNDALAKAAFHDAITGFNPDVNLVERGSRLREGRVLSVLPNYFAVLGVRASAGRLFGVADADQNAKSVVLSERMWKQLFPEKEQFEPSKILVNTEPRTVVGLLPYEADFPGANTDVWQLIDPAAVANTQLRIVRLRDGYTREQMVAELQTIAIRFRQQTGEGKEAGYRIDPMIRPTFHLMRFHVALIGSVIAVLLIACANLANLQLARGVARARELATRAAVGASRGQIILQLSIESAWLALGGLLLGSVLTAWGIRVMHALVPPTLEEYVMRPQVSWRVLAFAVGATLFCLALVGLAPAWKLSRVDIHQLLKSGAGTGTSKRARRQYGVLVVAEVALALSLLCSAGLLIHSASEIHAFNVDNNFHGLVGVYVRVANRDKDSLTTRREWSERVVRQALQVDSVVNAATVTSARPPKNAISIDDPQGGAARNVNATGWWYSLVSSDYLNTVRVPIVKGRGFSPGEFAEPQIVIDEKTARGLFPGTNPVGRLIKLDSASRPGRWLRVIGVAKDRKRWFNTDRDMEEYTASLPNRAGLGAVYVLNAADTVRVTAKTRTGTFNSEFFRLEVRSAGDPRRLPTLLRRELGHMGPSVWSGYPETWEQSSGIEYLRSKHDFVASLFALFALLALSLAALGVYAIIAHMVAQRTREFGVRIAVGANSREIRQLVIREGNVLALLGIALGLLITIYSASLLRAFVFSDYDRYDSRVFAAVAAVLFAVAWLASYIPARRAMRIDPIQALKND